MKTVAANRYLLYGGIAGMGCLVDLATKHWAFSRLGMPYERESLWLVDEVFGFTTSLNEGALFGFGQGRGLVFSALSLIAIAGIVYWLFIARAALDRSLTIALGIVSGGILGNLWDRLGLPALVWGAGTNHLPGERVYAVRDFVHFRFEPLVDWPIFNVADTLLVCGAVLLVWHAIRTEGSVRDGAKLDAEAAPPS